MYAVVGLENKVFNRVVSQEPVRLRRGRIGKG
jgi:hypothetical protein